MRRRVIPLALPLGSLGQREIAGCDDFFAISCRAHGQFERRTPLCDFSPHEEGSTVAHVLT